MRRLIASVMFLTFATSGIVLAGPPPGLPAKKLKSSRPARPDSDVQSVEPTDTTDPSTHMKSSRPEEADGTLSVLATPDAQVSVDGEPVGGTPVGPLALSAGDHMVVLTQSRSGMRHQVRVFIRPGQAAVVRHTFPASESEGGSDSEETGDYEGTAYRKALEDRGIGLLNVTADPVGRVFIDDVDLVQTTPLVDHEVPAGQHEITVRFLNGGEAERNVQVQPGASLRLHFRP